MHDMFDDFMDELRRRQAGQGRKSSEPGAEGEADPAAGSTPDAADRPSTEGSREDAPVTSNGTDSGKGSDRDDEDQGLFRAWTRRALSATTIPGTVHVILQAEDDGTPHLFAYRRTVIEVVP